MPEVRYLCSGVDCGIRGDCGHWDGNNNCPEECYGIAYFIKPPYANGSCAQYEDIFKRGKEREDGSF